MSDPPADRAEASFDRLAESLLAQPDVSRSTMMGLPCLRRSGAFFASYDRRTGNLVVKLSEARVSELIETAQALPFAPAGRRFRQWAAIPPSPPSDEAWADLLTEAHAFAAGS
ncbi:MAG TPA: hypothetical protein VKB57_05935 [Acidimicrobiales bacterium]|nr:hypothetical protein [Acidimicrobiales bacterium]